eukprot:TRINITY_DN8998_c0_g1_i2.p2 TRINITY_DN8998_c0_g1~~TRINITY_DN8998_c0_g1_i2.p2  ORF type:complete len:112 (+),score=0.20 TRINITY_DN8998_c0_g1_i2:1077-1412(+)
MDLSLHLYSSRVRALSPCRPFYSKGQITSGSFFPSLHIDSWSYYIINLAPLFLYNPAAFAFTCSILPFNGFVTCISTIEWSSLIYLLSLSQFIANLSYNYNSLLPPSSLFP